MINKIGFWLRWIWFGLIINLIMWIAAKFLYPLAYYFRNYARYNTLKPLGYFLWLFLDDETDYGPDWFLKGRKKNWWSAYKWSAIRNPMWNVYQVIKPKEGRKMDMRGDTTLVRNHTYHPATEFAVLKYVDKDGKWMDNKGEYLSMIHSIIGSAYLWYTIKDTLYYRRSLAKYLFGNIWIEFQIGTNDKRYTFRFKIKNVKVYEYTI